MVKPTIYALATTLFLQGCTLNMDRPDIKEEPQEPTINEKAPTSVLETDPQTNPIFQPEEGQTAPTTNGSLESIVFSQFISDPGNPDSLYNQNEPYGNRTLGEIDSSAQIQYTGPGFAALWTTNAQVRTSLYLDLRTQLEQATASTDQEVNQRTLDRIITRITDNHSTRIVFNSLIGDDEVERAYMLIFTTTSPVYGAEETPVAYLALVPETYQRILQVQQQESQDAFGDLK